MEKFFDSMPEICPYCNGETFMSYMVEKCEHCGKYIVCCSMCDDQSHCHECKWCDEAWRLEKEEEAVDSKNENI